MNKFEWHGILNYRHLCSARIVKVSLRVANLSRSGYVEFLVVNPTGAPCQLSWKTTLPVSLSWENSHGKQIESHGGVSLRGRGWVVGYTNAMADEKVSCVQTELIDQGGTSL
jgi:hypothetical protein